MDLRRFLRYTLLVSIGVITLSACDGVQSQPSRIENCDDHLLSCNDISNETNKLMTLTHAKTNEKNSVDRSNLTAYIAGQLLLFPLLGMDVTGSAKIERNAIFKRLQRLQRLSEKQTC